MGIRKLRRWEVFGDEGFGECRASDIGFELDFGVKLKTRLSPGRIVVWAAQGACLVRAKVRAQGMLGNV